MIVFDVCVYSVTGMIMGSLITSLGKYSLLRAPCILWKWRVGVERRPRTCTEREFHF